MASSGLETTITTASGLVSRILTATSPTIFAFVESRSSRLMPGLRAMPAVTTTTSLPAASAQSVVPVTLESKPTIGEAWNRSSALPAGMPSVAGMSSSTMSPSSAAAHQWAVVAPTLPAPMIAIFARRMAGGFRRESRRKGAGRAGAPYLKPDASRREGGAGFTRSAGRDARASPPSAAAPPPAGRGGPSRRSPRTPLQGRRESRRTRRTAGSRLLPARVA